MLSRQSYLHLFENILQPTAAISIYLKPVYLGRLLNWL